MAEQQTLLADPATDGVRAVAHLARDTERAQALDLVDVIETGITARVLTGDERIEIVDTEHLLGNPHNPRGSAVLWEPVDFVSYVNRLAGPSTTTWANPERTAITAVFDDHTDHNTGGWRRHRATLDVRPDPEWLAWTKASGHLGTQEEFAEFLEDHYSAVVSPDAATMLEIATTFQASRSASFERGTRLQSGDVQLRFTEATTASAGARGQIEVPEKFTIRVAPFLGVAPVELVARLRYRVADGRLRIGFVLHRPDLAEREAFDRIRAVVVEGCPDVQHHLGEAPMQLHPHAATAPTPVPPAGRSVRF
jgi:uncharacterized protein YfdQ (DUF2303 family)